VFEYLNSNYIDVNNSQRQGKQIVAGDESLEESGSDVVSHQTQQGNNQNLTISLHQGDDDEETEQERPDWSCDFQADGEETNASMSSSASLSTRDLICWCFQIARGMDYLVSKKV